MKSVCIKTNNKKAINYLLENIKNLELDNVYFSCHEFRLYTNIIVHYVGTDLEKFLYSISNILANLVIDIFQEEILRKILSYEYFYFENTEKREILQQTKDFYNEDFVTHERNFDILYNTFYTFIKNNTKLYLNGFITFRIKNYLEELCKMVDIAINNYLIEKEYTEFISLLKMYINSEESKSDVVHFIYHNSEPIILDKDKNIIKTDINALNAKFLSDISFSSNDIALNTLLSIVPQKIYIHLIDSPIDEFINTLTLIFENRVQFCTDCNICRLYKNNLKQKS